jgi:hypothetical protein
MLALLFVLMFSELIFGKGAALSSNMAYREAAKFYYNVVGNYLCNMDEKRDPSGRFHSLGSQMLEKADGIWSIGDKNVDFSKISSEERNLLEWKSKVELEKGRLMMKRSLVLIKIALAGTALAYLFSIPLGFAVLPFYSSGCGLFLVGSTLAFNSQINDVALLEEGFTYNNSQLQTHNVEEGLTSTRGGEDVKPSLWRKITSLKRFKLKRFIDETTLINAGSKIRRSRLCQNVGLCVNATGSWLILGTVSSGLIPLVARGGPFHILVGKIPIIGPVVKNAASDGATRASVFTVTAAQHIDSFMRPFFPRAEYYTKFYEKYYVIQAEYKNDSFLRNKHMQKFCDGDVLKWVREISGNIDCYCNGKEYIVEPTLIENLCEANYVRCSDSFSDFEQMREAIIRRCASSSVFKSLAGGLVEEADKKALIGNAKDRFERRVAKSKPNFGIEFASDMFKNKDSKAVACLPPPPTVPLNGNHTLGANDVRVNFMRIKSVKLVDAAQKSVSIAKKKVEMVDLGELFERGSEFLPKVFTDGVPKVQMVKKVVPEVIKEVVPEVIKEVVPEVIKEVVPETARNAVRVTDGFGVGKLAAKKGINFKPRFF